jgi:hypothetical protein
VAWSQRSHDAGYATPAALVLSLALALVAVAMTGRSLQLLRLSRADLERDRLGFALDGAHLAAAAAVVRSTRPGPYRWTFASDAGWVTAVAEPEALKLGLEHAEALDDAVLTALEVAEPATLKLRLLDAAGGDADVATIDDSPLWRECGPSLVSVYGQQDRALRGAYAEPGLGPDPQSWRVGQVWRVSITATSGWRDERTIRFTGDARHPAAVVTRRLSKTAGRGDECEARLSQIPAA